MAAAVHRPNRAQMGPSGEIARMAHLTQPMAIDRVRGRSRTRTSPQPGYTSPIGRSTEIHGLSEAQNGVFGGFRGSKNSPQWAKTPIDKTGVFWDLGTSY